MSTHPTATATHEVTAQQSLSSDLWMPSCSCGWRTSPTITIEEAEAVGAAHYRSASAPVSHRAELNETTGRFLGERGIFRHFQPTDAEALQAAQEAGEPVLHVMSTCLSGVYDGDVTGELVRWAHPDGDLAYEARIRGLPQHGTTDLIAAELGELCDVAKVLGDLRYEWGAMVVYGDWSVSRREMYTGPRT